MVSEVLVEPGQRVDAGQVLARLEDREIRASIALLRLRAESDLAIDEARSLLELATNELGRVEEAHRGGAVSDYEVERARLEVKRRTVALDMARQKKGEAELQLEQTLAAGERYVLRAPASGTVEGVEIEAGESVRELEDVVRVVSVDPLRIDVAAPLRRTLALNVGDPVEVRWSAGFEPEVGRIVHIAGVADAASGTRLVRVRVENPEGRPAGARVHVRLEAEGE
jgi:RND family efflux transporter MFP subunit